MEVAMPMPMLRTPCRRLWAALFALACAAAGATTATQPDAELRTTAEALARARAAVVGVHAMAVDDARSNATLGRERRGSGVVIDVDGLVATIGYLILEADRVELVLDVERVVPARVVAYDLASGFGLLQPLVPIRVPPAPLGRSAALAATEPLMIASGGEDAAMSVARLVSQRAFAGFWEYHLDHALFTAPPRTDHSGAGLFNSRGELVGIGSLVVMDAAGSGGPAVPGNMFVPVDLLKSILPELRRHGATRASTRPWLGMHCVELDGGVHVARVLADSPAEAAGLQRGDRIVRIDGHAVGDLASLYRRLWRGGGPERDVKIAIDRDGTPKTLTARAQDRMKMLRRPKGI